MKLTVGDRIINISKTPEGLDNFGKFGTVKGIAGSGHIIQYDDGSWGVSITPEEDYRKVCGCCGRCN